MQILFDFGATRMQNSAGVRRVRCATCTTSEHLSAESLLRPASRLHDGGVRKLIKIVEILARKRANAAVVDPGVEHEPFAK